MIADNDLDCTEENGKKICIGRMGGPMHFPGLRAAPSSASSSPRLDARAARAPGRAARRRRPRLPHPGGEPGGRGRHPGRRHHHRGRWRGGGIGARPAARHRLARGRRRGEDRSLPRRARGAGHGHARPSASRATFIKYIVPPGDARRRGALEDASTRRSKASTSSSSTPTCASSSTRSTGTRSRRPCARRSTSDGE